jgi:hypothetical protein
MAERLSSDGLIPNHKIPSRPTSAPLGISTPPRGVTLRPDTGPVSWSELNGGRFSGEEK